MIKTVVKKVNLDGKTFTYDLTYEDGTFWSVPNDPGNRHCKEIQEWIEAGNTPDEA